VNGSIFWSTASWVDASCHSLVRVLGFSPPATVQAKVQVAVRTGRDGECRWRGAEVGSGERHGEQRVDAGASV